MNCHQIKRMLSSYLDKQLSSKDKERVDKHLKLCPKCRKELEQLKQLVAALGKMPRHPAPPEIMTKVNRYSEKQKDSGWRLFFSPLSSYASPWLNYLALAFVILMVALSASYLYFRLQPFRRTEMTPKAVSISPEVGEEDKALLKDIALSLEDKKSEKKKAVAEDTPVPEKEEMPFTGGLKMEKSKEPLAKPEQEKGIEQKDESRALPIPPPALMKEEVAPSAAKKRSVAVEKFEVLAKKSIEKERSFDHLNAIPSECQPEIPGAPGSLENPLLSRLDPLLEITDRVEPVLPKLEGQKLKADEIVLQLIVDNQGRVRQIESIKSTGTAAVNEAVIKAVKQWKFKSPMCGNKPAATKGRLTIKLGKP